MARLRIVTEETTHYSELAPAILRLNDFDPLFSIPTFLEYADWKKCVKNTLSNYYGLPFCYSVTLPTRRRQFYIEFRRDSLGVIYVSYVEYKIVEND